jgi:hypothetical protein
MDLGDFGGVINKADNLDYVTTEEEPLFDAADATRRKDIFVQHGFTTNVLDDYFPRQ